MGNELNVERLKRSNDEPTVRRPSFLEVLRRIVAEVGAGKAVDPNALLAEADLSNLKAGRADLVELARALRDASELALRVERGQVPASNYDPKGLALTQKIDAVLGQDPQARQEVWKLAADLQRKVDTKDQPDRLEPKRDGTRERIVPSPTERKPEIRAATSAEYRRMLGQITSGQNLPPWSEVERVANAEVARLAKKNVPEENQRGVRELLYQAHRMASSKGKDPAAFEQAKGAYRTAVESRRLWWTLGPEELSQMQSGYQQLTGETLPGQRRLEAQLDAGRRQNQVELERRRSQVVPRPSPNSRRPSPERRTPEPRRKVTTPIRPKVQTTPKVNPKSAPKTRRETTVAPRRFPEPIEV